MPVRGAAKPPAGATKEAELEKMLRKQEEEIKQQQQAGVRTSCIFGSVKCIYKILHFIVSGKYHSNRPAQA